MQAHVNILADTWGPGNPWDMEKVVFFILGMILGTLVTIAVSFSWLVPIREHNAKVTGALEMQAVCLAKPNCGLPANYHAGRGW